MRKIIALNHVSLDGVVQAPGGPQEDRSGGFEYGGWSMSYGDAVMGQALDKAMSAEFDLLLGRRTYEIFAAYWPYAGDNSIANVFNKTTKFVATNSLQEFDWENTQGLNGDAADSVRQLKKSDGPELHIWGSGNLLQTLIAADLVDEFQALVYPVILGKGKRLFGSRLPPRALTLVESISTSTGVLLNTYRPAGPLAKPTARPETPSAAELARREKIVAEGQQ